MYHVTTRSHSHSRLHAGVPRPASQPGLAGEHSQPSDADSSRADRAQSRRRSRFERATAHARHHANRRWRRAARHLLRQPSPVRASTERLASDRAAPLHPLLAAASPCTPCNARGRLCARSSGTAWSTAHTATPVGWARPPLLAAGRALQARVAPAPAAARTARRAQLRSSLVFRPFCRLVSRTRRLNRRQQLVVLCTKISSTVQGRYNGAK